MRITKLRFAMLGLVFAAGVYAAPCPIAATPLSTYIGFGAGGCTVNGELVDNFAFTVLPATTLVSPLTASAISVTPFSSPNFYQLFFFATGTTPSTAFMVTGTDKALYEIDFTWDPVVVGAEDDLQTNTPVFPGTATVTTSLCAGSTFGAGCPPPTNTLVVSSNGIVTIPKAITFFPPVSVVGTQSVIDLEANGALLPPGGSSTITGFKTAVFSPEPAAFGLAASGLFALVLWRVRRRRQPRL
jgi:hypothetical protein